MASSRDRQRKLAREKLERQKARRAVKERRTRRIRAGVGAVLAVLVIAGGVAWLGGAFDRDPPADPAADDICAWTPQSTSTTPELKDVGTPPTDGIATSGTREMKVVTSQGTIAASLNLGTAPCGGESMSYLAGKKFYDNTECHEITAFGALRCGDPSGTGRGGPTYTFYNEDVPALPTPGPSASAAPPPAAPAYPAGTVALISDPPGNNGSQFLVFLKDYSPKDQALYPIHGKVTTGQDVLATLIL
ncbi:peptidylprolyl isomerase [Actinoplanes sp. NPDC051633]|uniref:peptidylprolyl isomerase n=1 Tax=Actinoplanes sp. NPDC051633 TaxID=3155670 RepID=UPI0034306A3C